MGKGEKNLQSSLAARAYLLFQSKFCRKSQLLMQTFTANLLPGACWRPLSQKHTHENPIIWNIFIVFLFNSRLCAEELGVWERKRRRVEVISAAFCQQEGCPPGSTCRLLLWRVFKTTGNSKVMDCGFRYWGWS